MILVFALVGAFFGNVLFSNDVAAKQHTISSLKTDFNKKTDSQYTPTPGRDAALGEIITMEVLIEYAQANGMIESRDAIGLVNDDTVALSR